MEIPDQIKVDNPSGVSRGVALMELDGKLLPDSVGVRLANDGAVHRVHIVLG